jgi:hypothetical protein
MKGGKLRDRCEDWRPYGGKPQKGVCFNCRMTFHSGKYPECPKCGNKLQFIGPDFRPPRKSDVKRWRAVQLLVEKGGVSFWNCCGDRRKLPETLGSAKMHVKQEKRI